MILRHRRAALRAGAVALSLLGMAVGAAHAFPDYPITEGQRRTARDVAQAGVPLSELAPNAPEFHIVKRGDTLWDISRLFLRSPWRWPELWGMNMAQIRNPHLIYPGQKLVLVRRDGRAFLQLADEPIVEKLSPRARASDADALPISSIPLHLIQPFLNDAVVLETNELEGAPRIVAAREGRVLLGRGETAYVRGEIKPLRDWRVYRAPRALKDPVSGEVLGYEAAFVGAAEYLRPAGTEADAEGRTLEVPATFVLNFVRQEAGLGDRLMAAPPRDDAPYVPHAPAAPVDARVVSIYGEGLSAGQNHIVALNRGRRDGMERGHVLAVLRRGEQVVDRDDPQKVQLKLPDEPHGQLFVFRVFERVSYALILNAQTAVQVGDRCREP